MLDKIKSNGGLLCIIARRIIKRAIRKQYGIDVSVDFSDIDVEYDGGLVKMHSSLYAEIESRDVLKLIKE